MGKQPRHTLALKMNHMAVQKVDNSMIACTRVYNLSVFVYNIINQKFNVLTWHRNAGNCMTCVFVLEYTHKPNLAWVSHGGQKCGVPVKMM